MEKFYTSLGLMSGTSMDGVDASVIKSDGENNYEPVFDKYFEYDEVIYSDLLNLRDKINSKKDLTTNSSQINELERKITLFHAKISEEIIRNVGINVDLIGFHGQTIFHNAQQKISKQIGDGNLLSSLLKKDVVYNFRENDIFNGGQGAPLASIFHNLLIQQRQIEKPACILNIGGIANITLVVSKNNEELKSFDV
jgi:anhydro-N-acetylmuramic acid kinase